MPKRVDELLKIMTCEDRRVDQAQAISLMKELAVSHGIRMVFDTTSAYPYGWDGTTLRIECREDDWRAVFDAAHEIGHWLCASPQRRTVPEFALGSGFSTRDVETAEQLMALPINIAQFEEGMVCLLAGVILHRAGVDTLQESEMVGFASKNVEDDPRRGVKAGDAHWINDTNETDASMIRRIDFMIRTLVAWGIIDNELKLTGRSRTSDIEVDQLPKMTHNKNPRYV